MSISRLYRKPRIGPLTATYYVNGKLWTLNQEVTRETIRRTGQQMELSHEEKLAQLLKWIKEVQQ